MSRGPGKVERAIEAAFASEPNSAFTADRLIRLVFPGINLVEKRHRVTVLRAARSVASRMQWWARKTSDNSLVYFNPIEARSLALAESHSHRAQDEVAAARSVDLPGEGYRNSLWEGCLPGGRYDKEARRNLAERNGDTEEAERLRADMLADARASYLDFVQRRAAEQAPRLAAFRAQTRDLLGLDEEKS